MKQHGPRAWLVRCAVLGALLVVAGCGGGGGGGLSGLFEGVFGGARSEGTEVTLSAPTSGGSGETTGEGQGGTNFGLVAHAPEPSSAVLFGGGLAVFSLWRRRKSRSKSAAKS